MFSGGAIGAAVAAAAWQIGNWNGVCLVQIGFIAAMGPVLLWLRREAGRRAAA
jgi:hypothetical protein